MGTNKLTYMRDYYAKNKDRLLAQNREYREREPEKHLAKSREYHHKSKDEINERRRLHRKENPEHYRVLRYKRIYGLTPDEHTKMLEAQEDKCAICRQERELVVDHDHTTGSVRGLLCTPCNQAIGLLEEDHARFFLASAYLENAAAMMKAQAQLAPAGRSLEPGGAPSVAGI